MLNQVQHKIQHDSFGHWITITLSPEPGPEFISGSTISGSRGVVWGFNEEIAFLNYGGGFFSPGGQRSAHV